MTTTSGARRAVPAALTGRLSAGADAEDAPVHGDPGGGAGAAVRHQVVALLAGHALLPGDDGAAAHVLGLLVHSAAAQSGNVHHSYGAVLCLLTVRLILNILGSWMAPRRISTKTTSRTSTRKRRCPARRAATYDV